jgi:hypothetical protein
MTTQPTPKRWRPRFSVRTVVIVVTLVCCYAACWGPTKTRGIKDVTDVVEAAGDDPKRFVDDATIVAPFLLRVDDITTVFLLCGAGPYPTRRYYFWFFGYVGELPYERELWSM